jgi:hypothetical protein
LEEMAAALLEEAKGRYEERGRKVRLLSQGHYQAGSWQIERRVVYKAEVMEEGTNTRFVVTNKPDEPDDLYDRYTDRGETENRIKDLKVALKADRLSSHRFVANQFRLLLHARRRLLAYGHLEEETGGGRDRADAGGHVAPEAGEDRREGQGTADEGARASGLGASGTTPMARPFTSLRRRSWIIRVTRIAVEVLKRHVRRQAEEKMKLESLYRDEGLVFASGIGTPLDAQNIVNRSYKPLLESAGLPSNRFHDLRHTCATLLLAKAIHPKFVQALLGHASISITMDLYSHWAPAMGDQAAATMEDVLQEAISVRVCRSGARS